MQMIEVARVQNVTPTVTVCTPTASATPTLYPTMTPRPTWTETPTVTPTPTVILSTTTPVAPTPAAEPTLTIADELARLRERLATDPAWMGQEWDIALILRGW